MQKPILSSLVINTPYKFDESTTSPRIGKVFSLPFGFRADALAIFKTSFQFVFSVSLFMAVSSIFIMSLYLPLQAQNNSMLKSAKSLTNKQFSLQANLQETSSYTKLYTNAEGFSLKDSEEVIHVNNLAPVNIEEKENLITFNKYPTLQFAGF